jgi:hypothetical protein
VEPESVDQLLFLRSLVDPYINTLHEVIKVVQRSALDGDLADEGMSLEQVGADVLRATCPRVQMSLLDSAVSQLQAMGVVHWNRSGSGFVVDEGWRQGERLLELRRVVQAFM